MQPPTLSLTLWNRVVFPPKGAIAVGGATHRRSFKGFQRAVSQSGDTGSWRKPVISTACGEMRSAQQMREPHRTVTYMQKDHHRPFYGERVCRSTGRLPCPLPWTTVMLNPGPGFGVSTITTIRTTNAPCRCSCVKPGTNDGGSNSDEMTSIFTPRSSRHGVSLALL